MILGEKKEIKIEDVENTDQTTQEIGFDLNEVTEGLRLNREFFIHFFMQEKITVPVPIFHVQILDLLIGIAVEKLAIAVPRGHSKTTLVKLAIVYYFLFTDYRFVVYVSNTTTVAKDEVRDIINFMLTPNFITVFGKPIFVKENASEGLFIFTIGKKRCILRALGAGQQVRGLNIDNQRPEVLVCDDAEDDDNSETPTQRSKLRRWVYGPLFKACARKSKKIWIGNLISPFCLINDFCKSAFWSSIKFGCILANGASLWPEMFSLQYLKKDFAEYQAAGMTAKWFAEMMNMPIPEGMGLIKADEIIYKPARVSADLEYGFIVIDPAISERSHADETGITVHGWIDGVWQVVDHEKYRGIDPIRLVNVSIDLCFKWRIRVIGVESIAYQAALAHFFRFVLMERGLHAMEVIPLHSSQQKTTRIATFAGWLKNGSYALTEGEFLITEQLLTYDPSKRKNIDDLVDSAAYGPQMIEEHLNLIMFNPEIKEKETEQGIQICAY